MNYNKATSLLSIPRYHSYLQAANFNDQEAFDLYRINLRIAQTFHPLVGTFEVVLRNKLNEELKEYFNKENWILIEYEEDGFINRNFYLCVNVSNAISELKQDGYPVTSDRVVAKQSFSFWTEFFSKQPFKELKGRPLSIFEKEGKKYGRKTIKKWLTDIRFFRNRMNHNEPLCIKKRQGERHITPGYPQQIYQLINNFLQWLDPATESLVEGLNHFDNELEKLKELKEKIRS